MITPRPSASSRSQESSEPVLQSIPKVSDVLVGVSLADIFVWSVWTIMLLAALGLVGWYGTETLPQNDELWVLYDAGPEIQIDWLWKPWAEHRIPLAKLLWNGVLQLTDYDFRFGNFLTVLALASVAFAMVRAIRVVRGRTIVADAFFPLALLNFGQAQVFLWWWQVNHVLAPITACMLLLVLVLGGNSIGVGAAVVVAAGLVLLGVCGPGGLPYVVVLSLWLSLWTATLWPSLRGRERWGGLLVIALIGTSLSLVGAYFVDYTPYFPLNDPAGMPTWPPSPGLLASAATALQILGLSLGTATKTYAPYWGSGILVLGLASGAVLARAWLSGPKMRLRVLGLLMFLGAPTALVVVIAQSRAGMGLDYIYQGHYLTVMLPMLCAVYFIWEFTEKPWGRGIQFTLFVVLLGLLPLNLAHGSLVGIELQRKTIAFEHDISTGVPTSVLAERHFASDLVPRVEQIAEILKAHRKNGFGIFKRMLEDPVFRVEVFPAEPDTVSEATWRNGIASSVNEPAGGSSLTFVLPEARHIYAIRLRYAYIKTANSWPTLRMFWRHSRQEDFTDRDSTRVERKLVSTTPGPDQPTWALIDGKIQTDAIIRTERTLTAWADAMIDQFRLYPEFEPFQFRLTGIELLVPADSSHVRSAPISPIQLRQTAGPRPSSAHSARNAG